MLKTDRWHEVPITRVHSPEMVTALQLAAHQKRNCCTRRRNEADREGSKYQDTSTKWVQAAGTKYRPRPRAVVQRNTPFNREKRKLRAWSVPKQMSYLEQQPEQQAVVQRGNPTTKKIRRLKAGEGYRALQRATAAQRVGETDTEKRRAETAKGRATINL